MTDKRMVAFDDHGNWVDVTGGLTVMTVNPYHYKELIEELQWRHPASAKGFPISTAEGYDQDGTVVAFKVLDYVSQREVMMKPEEDLRKP